MIIRLCYFSPTGATLQVASYLADALGRQLGVRVECRSYTLPRERESLPSFGADDLILWATPVYAGRIPNKSLAYVQSALMQSASVGRPAIALVTFGNRAYDNALAELVGIMQEGEMHPIGAAAVVTRHAFSSTLGAGRPNADDLAALDHFALRVADVVSSGNHAKLVVPGDAHPERYYTPLKTNNAPAGFLKAKPSADADCCTRCGRCADMCPMGSITLTDGLPRFEGVCIKCQACRLGCPVGAITFADPDYQSHVAMIERTFAAPKQSEFFI